MPQLAALLMLTAALTALLTIGAACAATHHETIPSTLGVARSSADLHALLATPGPVTLETVDSATWQVPLSGLLNLDHAKSKSAGLADRAEPILVQFHVIRHPQQGMFIVDTGVERAALDAERAAVRGLVADFMQVKETLVIKQSLHAYLDAHAPKEKLAGVFLTHLHLDHVMGLPDVPKDTALYAGPIETKPTSFMNVLVGPNIERALAGHTALREWAYGKDGIVDIFGDGSVFALWMPGHTPGNTAYLVRTTTGPVLLTGDTSHTRWGWDNDVEPGTYSLNAVESAASFHKLKTLAAAHPNIEVRVGHQH